MIAFNGPRSVSLACIRRHWRLKNLPFFNDAQRFLSRLFSPARILDVWSLASVRTPSAPFLRAYEVYTGAAETESITDSIMIDQLPRKDPTSSSIEKSASETHLEPKPPPERPVVSRLELWSYYLYYNGNNGVGPMNYSFTLFQALTTAAGYDPERGPGSSCAAEKCVVPFGGNGKTRSVSSVVLIANGISFAIMTALFTTLGPAADYRNFGRWLLLGLTVACWAAQFASLALTSPSRWGMSMMLYIISFVTYGATLVFYAAQFPIVALNTPTSRCLKTDLQTGKLSDTDYHLQLSLEKSRISNISTMHSNIGFLVVAILNLSVLLPLAQHPLVNNYTIALTTAYWVLTGIWWFVFQKSRPGPALPTGQNYLTVGWSELYASFKQAKKLRNTFAYLVAFFLLADGLNTTGTLISIIQSNAVQFSFLQNTYFGIAQATTSIISTAGFWYIQKAWKVKTKNMFIVTNLVTVLIPFWGMMGIWTKVIGFHNKWEFWAYNVIFGLFQAPYYAYSQTIMAELSPPGQENMFFGLFGFSNRAASIIGPNVIQSIIDKTNNNWL
ncbi:hypothetical protein O181_058590, partial [Austropuccinia psidii MF-1]|nr:hypothetical protein [Austropuccinia psidii MF-1]